MYDSLLKPRNVHVEFNGIIYCSAFLIDQCVWKISYVNIFPSWFRWKVGWMIDILEEILKSGNLSLQVEIFSLLPQTSFRTIWHWTLVNARFTDSEITTFKFFSDVLTSIDAGGILIGSFKKNPLGLRSCYSMIESSFHDIPISLGLTWIFGVHQLPTEKVVLSLDFPT